MWIRRRNQKDKDLREDISREVSDSNNLIKKCINSGVSNSSNMIGINGEIMVVMELI